MSQSIPLTGIAAGQRRDGGLIMMIFLSGTSLLQGQATCSTNANARALATLFPCFPPQVQPAHEVLDQGVCVMAF